MKLKLITFFCVLLFSFCTNVTYSLSPSFDIIPPLIVPKERSLDKVKIFEVFSFQCVHCRDFFMQYEPVLIEKFGNKIEIIHYPIGWSGKDLGKLYFIAEENGKGKQLMRSVFQLYFDSGIRSFKDRKTVQMVAKLNNLEQEFKLLIDSPRIVQKMNNSINFAESRGIDSTPTFVIEGSAKVKPDKPGSILNLINTIEYFLKL